MYVHSEVDSWHMPISMSISFDVNTNDVPLNDNVSSFEKICWDKNKIHLFIREITSNVFRNTVNDLINVLPNDMNDAVTRFTDLFRDAAKCMKRTIKINPNEPKINNSYFDKECLDFMKKLRRSLHKYRSNRADVNKNEYASLRRDYKKLLELKKRNYCIKKLHPFVKQSVTLLLSGKK